MSFPKSGRKLRPESGKHFPISAARLFLAEDFDFTAVIAEALREAFGGSAAAAKEVMAFTGAGERTVRNWFEGKNGPSGINLVRLVGHSDEMLEVFLLMANRGDILTAKKLVDARYVLVEMLGLVEKLLPTEDMDG
jgi:hypothetical protein